jgi:hypothetical protein
MGSFSIWHWIIVLIIFSPVILGIMILGWQRRIVLRHKESGLTKNGYLGWCWTYLLFGWLVPIVRGEIGVGVLHLVITVFTLGFFQLVMTCLYNKQNISRLLTAGWEINDTEENTQYAKAKLGIVN